MALDAKPLTPSRLRGYPYKSFGYDGSNELFGRSGLEGIKIESTQGVHKLWYPSIQDTSTWSKFGAHGEHGDVFLFSSLGAL